MAGQTAQKLCLVIGPKGADDSKERVHTEWVLDEIIRPVMAGFPVYQVKWAFEDVRPRLIDAQLINDLLTADLVIADMSHDNPSALYEIGIRHMAQKPIIHIQLADEKMPFELSLYQAIKFSIATPREIRNAREALKAQVAATELDGFQVENPVTKARGTVQLKEHATAPGKVLLDQIALMNRRLSELDHTSDDHNSRYITIDIISRKDMPLLHEIDLSRDINDICHGRATVIEEGKLLAIIPWRYLWELSSVVQKHKNIIENYDELITMLP